MCIMKKWVKALICIAFSFMFCFLCVGYATLTDELSITGDASAEPQEGVFITNVMVTDGSAEVLKFYQTSLESLLANSTSEESGSVTFQIKVFNNTKFEYVYNGYTFDTETFDNSHITSITVKDAGGKTLSKGAPSVMAGEYLTIYATVNYTTAPSESAVSGFDTLVNYSFIPAAEYIPEVVVSGSLAKFEEILNTKETREELLSALASTGEDEPWIGNVDGAPTGDMTLIKKLFEDELSMEIDGKIEEVTFLLKQEDVDGDSSDQEMTIYMTTNHLTTWFGEAPVYAAVFKQQTNPDGTVKWVQQGELYEGKARIVGYGGSILGTGSFSTDTWTSTEVYYGKKSGSSISEIISAYKSTLTT